MKPPFNRKTAPGVKGGRVQKKNRHQFTARQGYVVDRESPAKGYRHVVTKRDVRSFVEILPHWDEVSKLIECIFLSSGEDEDYDGQYQHFDRERTGIITLPAWEEDLWVVLTAKYFEQHRHVIDRLGVACEEVDDGWQCRFTLTQAKAYMLLHIFMHELGHHVDRLRHKGLDRTAGGELFAENYANEWLEKLWPAYVSVFGSP